MRLFAQLSWYFRREWRRYLGAIALLVIIAVLQLIPPKVVGIVVDGVTQQHYTAEKVWMWIGALVLIAVMVYLLRYVWRVLLFGASYQLAVELREDFYRQLSRQHPAFYLRHRTGDLIARATNDVDRVVFAAGEGVLTLVDSLVMGCAVLIVMSTQISWQLTLLALLQRHFDVTHGEIRFHDLPLPILQLDSWRARLAVVNQTPFLFSDTVANNIALGKPDATQAQIERVAQLASVHDDILRLPQGYETEVGERGVMLSGGQKQRISIARALLLEAEILILDDALSAVDGRTEHQILHNLRQWGEGRTVIISAHRLSALTEASEILVLQHGHIAQRGRHEALAVQPGWYRDMYRYQQLEAALDEVPQTQEEALDA